MKQLPIVIGEKASNKKKPVRSITLVNHKKSTHDYILGIASIYGCRTADVLDDLVDHAKRSGLESVHGKADA